MQTLPTIILASKSPRRHELLQQMGVQFKVVLKEVDESYPENLSPENVALYIAEKKARAFDEVLAPDEIVLTADTIVCIDDRILGKPEGEEHAIEMLSLLSGRRHKVITGVSLLHNHQLKSFYDITEVYLLPISNLDIIGYVKSYKPFDKSGSYGIQEWIGAVAIEKIVGSYTNVMGLPTHRVYQELKKLG